jgi:hypothetical protein
MTYAVEIEAALAEVGQAVTLRRVGSPNVDVVLNARVNSFQPHELVGGILQGDRQVIVGAVVMREASWPAPPRKGDVVLISGKTTTIQGVESVDDGTETVRYNIQVRGG